MRVEIESTDQIVQPDGVRCRVWKARTADGVMFFLVHRVAVPANQPVDDLERELGEEAPPFSSEGASELVTVAEREAEADLAAIQRVRGILIDLIRSFPEARANTATNRFVALAAMAQTFGDATPAELTDGFLELFFEPEEQRDVLTGHAMAMADYLGRKS